MTTDEGIRLLVVHALQVTLVAVAVWGLILLFAKTRGIRALDFRLDRPHLAHALWALVLLKCLIPPVISSPLSLFEFPRLLMPGSLTPDDAAVAGAEITADSRDEAVRRFTFTRPAWIQDGRSDGTQQATGQTSAPPATGAITWILNRLAESRTWLSVWILGVGFCLAAVALRLIVFLRHIRRASSHAGDELSTLVQGLAEEVGVRRQVRVLLIDRVADVTPTGPAVIGIVRPTILLPKMLAEQMSAENLRLLLLHELIHIRRGDMWWVVLQTVSTSLCWFHPMAWLASSALTRETELACDEQTIAIAGCTGTTYARALLDVLDRKQQMRSAPALPGVRPMEVTTNRLEKIMRMKQGSLGHSPRWIAVMLVVGCVLVLPGGRWLQAQEESQITENEKPPAIGPAPKLPEAASQGDGTPDQVMTVHAEIVLLNFDKAILDKWDLDWQEVEGKHLQSNVGMAAGDKTLDDDSKSKALGTAGASDKHAWLNLQPVDAPDGSHFGVAQLPRARAERYLEYLKSLPDTEVLSAPRVATFLGQTSVISSLERRPFFISLGAKKDGEHEPIVKHLEEGIELALKVTATEPSKDQMQVEMSVTRTQVADVDLFTFATPGGQGARDSTTVQMPTVVQQRIELDSAVPTMKELFRKSPESKQQQSERDSALPKIKALFLKSPELKESEDSNRACLTMLLLSTEMQPRLSASQIEKLQAEGRAIAKAAAEKKQRPAVLVDCGRHFTEEELAKVVTRLNERDYKVYVVKDSRLLVPHYDVSLVTSLINIAIDDTSGEEGYIELRMGDGDEDFDATVLESAFAALGVKLRVIGRCDYVIDNNSIRVTGRDVNLNFGPGSGMSIRADHIESTTDITTQKTEVAFRGKVLVKSVGTFSTTADLLLIDSEKQAYMQGNLRCFFEDSQVSADRVTMDFETGELQLSGSVNLRRHGQKTVTAEQLRWNPETGETNTRVKGPSPSLDHGIPIRIMRQAR